MDDRAETKADDDGAKTVEYWPRGNLSYAIKSVIVIVVISTVVVLLAIGLLIPAMAR